MSTGINNGRGRVTTCSCPTKMSSSTIQKKTESEPGGTPEVVTKTGCLGVSRLQRGLHSGVSLHRKSAEAPAAKVSRNTMKVKIK